MTGTARSRCAASTRSSHAILSRAYSQKGFASGASSVIGSRAFGLSYAAAVPMKTYWPVRPAKALTAASTCAGV